MFTSYQIENKHHRLLQPEYLVTIYAESVQCCIITTQKLKKMFQDFGGNSRPEVL